MLQTRGHPYNGSSAPTSTTFSQSRYVTGYYITKAPLVERRRLAAGLVSGAVIVTPVTKQQAAALTKVPLCDLPRRYRHNSNGKSKPVETLAEHLERATPTELVEAARVYGIGRLFDSAIVPVINDDRVARTGDAAV